MEGRGVSDRDTAKETSGRVRVDREAGKQTGQASRKRQQEAGEGQHRGRGSR